MLKSLRNALSWYSAGLLMGVVASGVFGKVFNETPLISNLPNFHRIIMFLILLMFFYWLPVLIMNIPIVREYIEIQLNEKYMGK